VLFRSDLARKAASLKRRTTLTGWLYTSAHFAATKAVRTENRRRDREEKFMREPIPETAPEPDWEKLRPTLDAAMHELKESDREAILLRYFENRPFAEVGAKLGLNENADRMRVERALEKLQAVFLRRGIAATSALATIISANAVQVAPSGLAATLTTASLAGAGTGTLTLLKIMTTTQLKLGVTAIVVAGTATMLVVQHQTQTRLRGENDRLQQQLAQLKSDNESLFNRLAVAGDAKSLPDEQLNELLRLRGEVGVLRRQTNELQNSLARSQNSQPRPANPRPQQPPAPLPADYPKTPDAATKGIFDVLARGDWDAFITNFAEPSAPREAYAPMFSDEMKSNMAGMEIISIGEPTNWLSTASVKKWFVPYEIRLNDGSIKSHRLSVGQDVETKRFFFDGGF
jgi:RNA polymerase sigma factor (sigma-70 family)